MTQSWHLPLEFTPPLIGMVLSDQNYSYAAFYKHKECVINIPTAKLAKAVVGCGNTSGRNTDKFKKFSLTPVEASYVDAPLIKECYASLECRIVDSTLAKKYAFFVVEVIKAWVDSSIKNPKTLHHRGRGQFMIAGRTVHLNSKKL